jgi:hypothetical protein
MSVCMLCCMMYCTVLYVSDLDSFPTSQVFYKYFYNPAHRLRLEKILYLELSRSTSGFL